ncbi:hypothetical protein EIP91_006234 [Steccherinum ochraceum]|uniref:F-box domain-containing protein n=1 Tax=Steccherinum ochraceum TaxID=92696 RepID=A0A4V2MVQ4_9APHY|nr:hypothetical protein EIP91_006234 [Steccherinum ochraceum]
MSHKVFSTFELVAQIVKLAAAEEDPWLKPAGWQDLQLGVSWTAYQVLKALSLTAITFREHCLNEIWDTHYSIIPLLRSIDVIEEDPDSQQQYYLRQYVFRRPIEHADLPTLLGYSSRIRSLAPAGNLHSMLIIPVVLKNIGRDLKFLSLYFPAKDTPAGVVDLLVSKMLYVTELEFSGPGPAGPPADADHDSDAVMATLLRAATSMQTLQLCVDCGEEVWETIARTSTLRKLDLMSTESPFYYGKTFQFPCALTSLSYSSLDMNAAIHMLNGASFPALQELSLIFDHPPASNPEQISQLSHSIACSCPNATLQTIYLWNRNDSHRGDSEDARIILRWKWDLDDTFIHELSEAWPDIEELYIDPIRDVHQPSRITMAGLVSLATRCKSLKSFGAIIDAALPTSSTQVMDQTFVNDLSLLIVARSDIQETAVPDVVRFLSHIFPKLKDFEAGEGGVWGELVQQDEQDVNVKRWKQVEEHVRRAKD